MRKLVVVIIALIAIGVALQPAFAGLGISLVLGLGWAVWELHLRDESDE